MECLVTVQMLGEDVPCGRLFTHVRRGVETASFVYDRAYLARADAFPISPDLPLSEGTLHAPARSLFGAFEDCMPDRWGRNLLVRAERNAAREEGRTARSLFEGDLLVGVSDQTRQGALRVWQNGEPVARQEGGVPREVDIPRLLSQADAAEQDMDADIRDLLRAGSSLGGARPKASVVDAHGSLHIAKFPQASETLLEDTCAWEHVALKLAERCGIDVPEARLLRVAGRSVLILRRFDRKGHARVPYLSGLSAVQGTDGGSYSYLELAEFLEEEGAAPSVDLPELWRRILFSCAIGNTDDHLRNHGFLRERDGWRLSPVFDVNPTPGDHPKYLSSSIDFDERLAVPEVALQVAEFFRVGRGEGRRIARQMARELADWRRVAVSDGISAGSVDRMASCFAAGVARLKEL